MKVKIIRDGQIGATTVGRLIVDGMEHLPDIFTIEEKWKNNERGHSCIPLGTYNCIPHGWNGEAVKQKRSWEITHVPNRTAILIHSGNTILDIEGCCIVGFERGYHVGLPAVLKSRPAMELLRAVIGQRAFTLTIIENPVKIDPKTY